MGYILKIVASTDFPFIQVWIGKIVFIFYLFICDCNTWLNAADILNAITSVVIVFFII
jgi:hypothetical protein